MITQGVTTPRLRWLINMTVRRLPADVRERLQQTRVVEQLLLDGGGFVQRTPHGPIIVLDPMDKIDDARIIGIIAHECAHIVRCDHLAGYSHEAELGANRLARSWGFGREIDLLPDPRLPAWDTPQQRAWDVPWDKLKGVKAAKTVMLPVQVKAKKANGGQILITTSSPDRVGDRVFPQGARLDNYTNNPVVLWGHDYQRPESVIGRTLQLERQPDGIVADFEFRPSTGPNDPQAIVLSLWENNFIRTASIGFQPIQAKPNEFGGVDITEWEMLEWSLVSVPANAGALRI